MLRGDYERELDVLRDLAATLKGEPLPAKERKCCDYVPTPEEIAQAAAQIRATWSPREAYCRATGRRTLPPLEVVEVWSVDLPEEA
jgi:hypothetical protein